MKIPVLIAPATLLLSSAVAAVSGCASTPKPQPLTPEAFISPRSANISGANGAAEGSGGTVGAGESAKPAVAIPANGVSNQLDKNLNKPAPAPTPVPRPGDDITIETVLRPYRGERIVRQIPIKIPTSTPKGSLRILVSDGETLDRMRRTSAGAFGRKMDLGTTIALLNKEHANHRLYVSMLEANPQAMVEDKVMPTLPLSVMNVMDGMRGTQDMIVSGESAVNESSTPFDYVVTGSQVIVVNVK